MRRSTPRVHAFMTSLALCLTLVALAVVLTGCRPSGTPVPHPSPGPGAARQDSHTCRCGTRTDPETNR